ncbi:MAG TPA: 23S rRNA (adenine(2503)-C(2))-methyltransferase RlmN [Firmicutes bacterium]|nr:23S rRNA (adenine(2503)-C(2))-methyltransferase RlmN [Bacillota bacterium]
MDNKGNLDLTGLFCDELAQWLQSKGFAAYRAKQLFDWIHRRVCVRFQDMGNLPKDLIALLQAECESPLPLEERTRQKSRDGTEKYLFALKDGAAVETVLIPEDERRTVCISAQVGCAMGCSFCATGLSGFTRNLSAGEIVGQVLWVENRLRGEGSSITNVVYMGMGEPLANYRAVLKSLRLLNDPLGLNLGARRLTISTCGLVPEIKRLAQEELQVNLAISLHAAHNRQRTEIMPINKRYPLEELLAAARYYTERTGRRISFEYALIKDFNDGAADAHRLRDLLSGLLCHVNLIPVNPVVDARRPAAAEIKAFAEILAAGQIPVSIRKERGSDIDAACGQLRGKV